MIELKPILDVDEVITYNGRIPIQLDIPKGSTLSAFDIERIKTLSSWDLDPNKYTDRTEFRGANIDRSPPHTKQGIELAGLYLSGIGYKDMSWHTGHITVTKGQESLLLPPNNTNFMNTMSQDAFTTFYYENGTRVHSRPEYRAMGAYEPRELETKLLNTGEVSKMSFDHLAVPHVEAYGRFLHPDLSNENGYFGFIVFPVPESRKSRFGKEVVNFFKARESEHGRVAVNDYYGVVGPHINKIILALAEMHHKGIAHLQLHVGNLYSIGGFPYIMDWQTKRNLDNDQDNELNRQVDVRLFMQSEASLLETVVGDSKIPINIIRESNLVQAVKWYKKVRFELFGESMDLEIIVE